MKIIFLTVLMNTVAIMLSSVIIAAGANADSRDRVPGDMVNIIDNGIPKLPIERNLARAAYRIYISGIYADNLPKRGISVNFSYKDSSNLYQSMPAAHRHYNRNKQREYRYWRVRETNRTYHCSHDICRVSNAMLPTILVETWTGKRGTGREIAQTYRNIKLEDDCVEHEPGVCPIPIGYPISIDQGRIKYKVYASCIKFDVPEPVGSPAESPSGCPSN